MEKTNNDDQLVKETLSIHPNLALYREKILVDVDGELIEAGGGDVAGGGDIVLDGRPIDMEKWNALPIAIQTFKTPLQQWFCFENPQAPGSYYVYAFAVPDDLKLSFASGGQIVSKTKLSYVELFYFDATTDTLISKSVKTDGTTIQPVPSTSGLTIDHFIYSTVDIYDSTYTEVIYEKNVAINCRFTDYFQTDPNVFKYEPLKANFDPERDGLLIHYEMTSATTAIKPVNLYCSIIKDFIAESGYINVGYSSSNLSFYPNIQSRALIYRLKLENYSLVSETDTTVSTSGRISQFTTSSGRNLSNGLIYCNLPLKNKADGTLLIQAQDFSLEPKVILPTNITVSPSEINEYWSTQHTLITSVYPVDADDKTITFESGNTDIATVTEAGEVQLLKAGNTTITIRSVADPSVYTEVPVVVKDRIAPTISNLQVSNPSPLTDEKVTFTYDVTYGEGAKLKQEIWTNKLNSYATAGEQVVKLQVKDNFDLLSNELQITLNVRQKVAPVITRLEVHPASPMHQETVTFSYDVEYMEGATFKSEQWTNKADSYLAGERTVKLRVQDTNNTWSDYASLTFTVQKAYVAPVIKNFTASNLSPLEGESVEFTYDVTYDDRSTFQAVEWENKQDSYSVGQHEIRVRVQDDKGLWSEWASITITVLEKVAPIITSFTMTPENPRPNEAIIFAYEVEYMNGATFKSEEWENKRDSYSSGQQTVRVRVTDSNNMTSEWAELTFTVEDPLKQPIVTDLTASNLSPLQDETVTFTYQATYDDRSTFKAEEWVNKRTSYSEAGEEVIKVRVQDSNDLWSEWASVTINVRERIKPVIETITMSPQHPFEGDAVTFSYTATYMDGATFQTEEWQNKQSSYEAGQHQIRLRVKDSNGTWSDWKEFDFTVEKAYQKPIITSLTASNLSPLEGEEVTFTYQATYDNRSSYQTEEWQNKKPSYEAGSHQVAVRVQDDKGLWSEWATITLNVRQKIKPIVDSLTIDPIMPIEGQRVTFTYHATYMEGASFKSEEWENKRETYEAGLQTVRVRVTDTHDMISEWKEVTFTVQPSYQAPVLHRINIQPQTIYNDTSVVFSYEATIDARSQIVDEIWTNKKDTYEVGVHEVSLKLIDDKGLESNVAKASFEVLKRPDRPVVTRITMSPEKPTVDDVVTFSYDYTKDATATIVEELWENKKPFYPEGENVVKLRIRDSLGQLSDEFIYTFEVAGSPSTDEPSDYPHIYNIEVDPPHPRVGELVKFSYELALDTNSHLALVKWTNKQSYFKFEGREIVTLEVVTTDGKSDKKDIIIDILPASDVPHPPKPTRIRHLEVTRFSDDLKRFIIVEGREV